MCNNNKVVEKILMRDVNMHGPIEVSDKSHPFSSMDFSYSKVSLSDFGYIEEEYFMSGYSNVYDLNEKNQLFIKKYDIPYETRIIIRRPANKKDRKNRVFIDIMNASNCYDIEDQWRRSYLYFMENGYSYVGITSKPVNVLSLKNFDYERYKSLNWSNGEIAKSPSIPDKFHRIEGCEEGLIWDMITQLGGWIRGKGKALFTEDEKIYLYLTGQSQSGMYLNTYVNQFHKYLKFSGKPLFDGYLSTVSGGYQRALSQTTGEDVFMCIREYEENEIDVPFITLNSEGDNLLFKSMSKKGLKASKNFTLENNKRRYYEVAGAPHTNAASPLVPQNSEIEKTKCPPRILDGEYEYRLNDFPLDYIINGLLEKLHLWSSEGIEPKIVDEIEKDEHGEILRDEFKNAMGGIRTAFTEVPKATYVGSIGIGQTNGTMTFFDKDKINEIYGSFDDYLKKFTEVATLQLKEKDITESDYNRMINWAKNINE